MGIYKYIRQSWNEDSDAAKALWRARLIAWRREPVTVRLEHPTRLDRARSVGYRAKQGVFVVRQRVSRGSHWREDWSGGRHSSNSFIRKFLAMNYRQIAEQRANKVFPNCEVLNSYYVTQDGRFYWYEIILVDRAHPAVLADPQYRGIALQRNRSARGLTAAARVARGLRRKGKGAEQARGKYQPKSWN